MTISQRFNSLFLVMALGLLSLMGFYVYEMEEVYDSVNFSNINIVPSIITLDHAVADFGRLRVRLYRHVLNNETIKKNESEGLIKASETALQKSLKDYELLVISEQDRFLLLADQTTFATYQLGIEKIIAASRQHQNAQAIALLLQFLPNAEKMNDALQAHSLFNEQLALQSSAKGKTIKLNAFWISIGISLITFVVVFMFGFFVARDLSRSLKDSVSVAKRIAAGDLSSDIKIRGDDETAQMLDAMQGMQATLAEVVLEFKHIVEAAGKHGDFSVKLNLIGKTGFIKELAEQLNNLSNISQAGLKDVTRLANAIAIGDLTQTINTIYPGSFGEMVDSLLSMQQVNQELEDRRWAKMQLVRITSKVQTAINIDDFGRRLLDEVCLVTGGVQALFYADMDYMNVQRPISGFGRNTDSVPAFAKGESLVGQCAQNLLPIVLNDPSGSILRLRSGLIDRSPSQVALLPLVLGSKSIGVLELAMISMPTIRQQMLLDELPLAITPLLEVLRRNLRNEAQSEEIQALAVELEAQAETLQETSAAMSQTNAMLNDILAAATEIGIIGTDLEGIITHFNSGAERLLGWQADEVIGKIKPNRFHVEEEVALARNLAPNENDFAVIVGDTSSVGGNSKEWTFVRKDGLTFAGLLMISPIYSEHGATTGYLGIVQDISARRQLEQEMVNARKMAEEVSRLKSDFLANMSHEIRTPMNGIIGMTHLALNTELTPRQHDYLKKIQSSGQHLLRIINDILDISKIEAGKLSIEHTEFELESALANVVNLIAEKATEKGLELILDMASNVPVDVVGDSLRLSQILINYANNALKFTEEGEIILIVRVREMSDEDVVLWFGVQDTGIGLSEEQISHLFSAFNQGDTSTTRKYGGTGLGLAIAKSLSEMMNGEVGVESILGKGSTFWFTAKLGIAHQTKRVLLPDPDIRGRHVLVVDDNDNARLVMSDMLTNMSFTVDSVDSGKEAVAAVKRADRARNPYELIFMDWHMPTLNGIEACRQIKALSLAEPPHMLLVTAYGREEVFHQAEDAGIHDVLVKPVNASILFDTTMRVLNSSNYENQMMVPASSTALMLLAAINGARILLVEDNEINQQVGLELLRQADFVVDLADNGLIALTQLQKHDYDLVLMDMQMPVMDGLTATIALRKIPRYKNLPVVAMTANVLPADRERCFEAGMNDFISKPIQPEVLWQALLKWIPARLPSSVVSPSTIDTPAVPAPIFNIAGIDAINAQRRLLGNTDLYASLLRKFCNTQGDMPQAIRLAIDLEDWATAQRHAHSIKGISLSIGANSLAQDALLLEQAIAERAAVDQINSLLDTVKTTLAQLIEEISLKLPEPILAAPMDAATAATLIDELRQMLTENNPEVMAWLETNMAGLDTVLPHAKMLQIVAAVHSFDLDDALRLLEES